MRHQPLPLITGILLAAGLSTRMVQPKQLLPFGEKTIVETVVDNMIKAKFSEVIVVVGHCAEQIKHIIGGRKVKIVLNSDYRDGMLSSVQTGVRALNFLDEYHLSEDKDSSSHLNNRQGFSLMLVDQPFITSQLIKQVIDVYANTEKGIVMPSYNYRRGHPVIFHHHYADIILSLDADSNGVRSLYKTFKDDICYVSVDTDDVLRDIDYPDDYKRALRQSS